MDLLKSDATDQLRALSDRSVGARELLDAAVDRSEQVGTLLNAVVSKDLDAAHAYSDKIDADRVSGSPTPRLAGMPMTIKDALDVEGLPASAGLSRWLGREATDAASVANARRAGAVIWGKTNTPVNSADWQTYNALYGTTNNPWDVRRTPGGSSGGSAAAVAAGITALEIGADIGGSLRIPASFCGVFAHKPTYGLVSQRGLVPPPDLAADLDLAVVGPVARSVRDLRLLLSVMSETCIEAAPAPLQLKGVRFGLWLDEPSFSLDPQVRAVIAGLASTLEGHGAEVELIRCPVGADRMMFAYTMLLFPVTHGSGPMLEMAFYEALRGPARIAKAFGAGPLSPAQGILGATARHRDWLMANEERARMAAEMNAVFDRYDAILSPVSPTVAFRHDHGPFAARRLLLSNARRISYLEMMNWIALATVLGLPSTVVPAGLSGDGLPVGVQVIGPHGRDQHVLDVAEAIEAATGGFRPPPELTQSAKREGRGRA